MGAGRTIKNILKDKKMTIQDLADIMEKPRSTVNNTLQNDNLKMDRAAEYGKALGYTLYFVDEETGKRFPIYID